MTYFETVIIYRGMPSGLDLRDPINLCFGLEKALAELLIFPVRVGSEESLFFLPSFFSSLHSDLRVVEVCLVSQQPGLCVSSTALC